MTRDINKEGCHSIMRITNQTRRTIIAKSCVWLDTVFGHARGLMFKPKVTPHVLAFAAEHVTSLHTFFVAETIDILFVNKNYLVCALKEGLVPWSFYRPPCAAQYIIEVPAKTIQRSQTQVGDRIRVHSTHRTR